MLSREDRNFVVRQQPTLPSAQLWKQVPPFSLFPDGFESEEVGDIGVMGRKKVGSDPNGRHGKMHQDRRLE
jgi:hypothetical protein